MANRTALLALVALGGLGLVLALREDEGAIVGEPEQTEPAQPPGGDMWEQLGDLLVPVPRPPPPPADHPSPPYTPAPHEEFFEELAERQLSIDDPSLQRH